MDWAASVKHVDMSKYRHDNLPSPEDPLFLDSLSGSLREIASAATDPLSEPSVSVEQFEVQLRRESFRLISAATVASAGSGSLSDLGAFWSHATLTCWHLIFMSETDSSDERYEGLAQPQLRKLPIILLEDILESCPLPMAVEFFEKYAPPMFPLLFGPLLWTLSLPKKEGPESAATTGTPAKPSSMPCWLPFLKLATNFLKRLKLHTPEQLLEQNTKVTGSLANVKYQNAVSSIMLILCQVYPLADKSAYRPLGSQNDQAMTLLEDEDEFEAERAQLFALSGDSKIGKGKKEVNVNFSLYESFWTLQKDFSRPNSIPIEEFSKRLRSLVTTLEHTQPKSEETTTVDEVRSYESRALESCSHRYLTSSRLLPIQLQDRHFRVQILTQVVIVCHHLSDISALLKKQVAEWQTRAMSLLKNEKPQQLALLQSVFEKSEHSWRKWRKSKPAPDLDKRQSSPLTGRKRKRSLGGAQLSSSALTSQKDKEGISSLSKKLAMDGAENNAALKDSCTKMRQSAPKLQKHLEDYVDALDPDSGIEAEYHPKNNAHFCWRAMRLLSAHHLGDIGHVSKLGDFEGMVRKVYAADYDTEIPGKMPKWMQDDDKDDEKEPIVEGKKQEKGRDQEDVEMEDAADKKGVADEMKTDEGNNLSLEPTPAHEATKKVADEAAMTDAFGPMPNPEKQKHQRDEKVGNEGEGRTPTLAEKRPNENEKEHGGEKDSIVDEGQNETSVRDKQTEKEPLASNKTVSATEGGFAAMDNSSWSAPPSQTQSTQRDSDTGGVGGQQQQKQEHHDSGVSAANSSHQPQFQQQRKSGDYASAGRSPLDNSGSRGRGADYRGGGQGRGERFDRGGGIGRDESRPRNERPEWGGGNRQRNDDRDHRNSDRSWHNDDRGRDRGPGGGRRVDDRRPTSTTRADDRSSRLPADRNTSTGKGDDSRGRDHHNRNPIGGGGSGSRYPENERRPGGGRSGGDNYASGGRSSHDNATSRGGGDYRGGGQDRGDRDRSRGGGPRRDRRGGRH